MNDNENCFYEIKDFNSVFFNREEIAFYVKENIEFTQMSSNTNSFELVHLDVKIGREITTLKTLILSSMNLK